jgi:dihydrofolate reductase
MGLLTFALNVTLDGCIDHREGIADDELHDYFTELMGAGGAMLFGRTTYELMESHWPAVARDDNAARSDREWAVRARLGEDAEVRRDRAPLAAQGLDDAAMPRPGA